MRLELLRTEEKMDKNLVGLQNTQFQHIWHKERTPNHKLMGMWMLLLRTVPMENPKMCWFAVNGVPVRYSLKEHALISGLDCHSYPPAFETLGSLRFVKRHFKKTDKISVAEVREKMKTMAPDGERLKIAVLFFLCTIIKGSKRYGYIDPFILRIVDDLKAVKTFPWGRYTFDDCIEEIFHMMEYFKEIARPSWCFPGFIISLELLACEAIPHLGMKFREDVSTADRGCPRMCKRRWRKQRSGGYLKGFPLEEINESLGSTEADAQRIVSILEPDVFEEELLSRIFEDNLDDEGDSYLSLNWNNFLVDRKKKIFWQDIFDLDKAGRALTVRREEKLPASIEDENASGSNEDVLGKFQENLMKMMEEGFAKINNRFDALEGRVVSLEKLPTSIGRALNDRFDSLEERVVSLEKLPASIGRALNDRFDALEKRIEDSDNVGAAYNYDCFGDNAWTEVEREVDRQGEGLGEGEGVGVGGEGVGGEGEVDPEADVECEGDREVDVEGEDKVIGAEDHSSPSMRPEARKRKTCPSKFKKSPFVVA